MTEKHRKYILAIDAGSTGIRSMLFDRQGAIVLREYERTPAMHPAEGATEHDPELLWQALVSTVKAILREVDPEDIEAIGITNQRSSFCIWDRETGKPYTNFINWQDVRAADTLAQMNRHPVWRMLKGVARLISRLVKSTLLIATSMLVLTTDHTIGKVRWLFNTRPDIEEKCRSGRAVFGTIDTWFIYKLTGGKAHLTDYTNASSTTMFNPFDLKWNSLYCKIFNIPMKMLPEVRDSNALFGTTDPGLFGRAIPICSAIGDQQSSLFGNGCFTPGDVKCSLGSGAFVCINVGKKGKVSKRGLFPLIAWVIDGRPVYMLEGQVATTGTLIDWLGGGIGLADGPEELNRLASEAPDTGGVIVVPTPTGIRFPYFKPGSRAAVLGLSLKTGRANVARAVLEGIALRIRDILDGVKTDAGTVVTEIMADGGVSRSDLLMQSVSDICGCTVRRAPEADMTAAGAAYLAGLSSGFWKDLDEIQGFRKTYTVFEPVMTEADRNRRFTGWRKAVQSVTALDFSDGRL